MAEIPNFNTEDESGDEKYRPKFPGLRKMARMLGIATLSYIFAPQVSALNQEERMQLSTSAGSREVNARVPTDLVALLRHNSLRTDTADEAVIRMFENTLETIDFQAVHAAIAELKGETAEPRPLQVEVLTEEEAQEFGLETPTFSPAADKVVLREVPAEQMAGELARQVVIQENIPPEFSREIGQYYENRWLVDGVSDDFFWGATAVVTDMAAERSEQKIDIRHYYDAKYAVAKLVSDLVGEELFTRAYLQGDFSLILDKLKEVDPNGRIIASIYADPNIEPEGSLPNTSYLGDLITGDDNDLIPLFAIRSHYQESSGSGLDQFNQALGEITEKTQGVCQISTIDDRFPGIIAYFNHPALDMRITAAIQVPLPRYIDQYLIFGENGREFNRYFLPEDAPEELMNYTRERAIPYRTFNLRSADPYYLDGQIERFNWGSTETKKRCLPQIAGLVEQLVREMQAEFSGLMPSREN